MAELNPVVNFRADIDVANNKILNAILGGIDQDPPIGQLFPGKIWFNQTDKFLRWSPDGSSIEQLLHYSQFKTALETLDITNFADNAIIKDLQNYQPTASDQEKFVTAKAVQDFVVTQLEQSNGIRFKSAIDLTTNPNFPAADAGHLYTISESGYIGGDATTGKYLNAGDWLVCKEDNTSSGNLEQVGDQWEIIRSSYQYATESIAGIVQLATDEEIKHGSGTGVLTAKKVGAFLKGYSKPFSNLTNDTITPIEHNLQNPKSIEIKDSNNQPLVVATIIEENGDVRWASTTTISGTAFISGF